jgi:CO dehydrogenase/acetyl-CoA synthase beta subunit
MNFFDDLINEVKNCLSQFDKKSYTSGKVWRDVGRNEVVLQRDSAYELDGIGFNLVTSQPIGDSEVVVIGSELNQITSATRFARISIIEMNDVEDEQKAYDLIRKVEYAKYHYFPQGFMVRTASTSHKEMVRISKSALAGGLSFEGVGNLLINKYKENNSVKSVKIIYVTDKMADYDKLESIAKKNYDITETLNHIMQNINFDCSTCNLKPICDEVEGMRELHFKNSGM